MQDVERLHAVMRRRPFSRRQRHRSHETGWRVVNGLGATSQPVATKKHAKADDDVPSAQRPKFERGEPRGEDSTGSCQVTVKASNGLPLTLPSPSGRGFPAPSGFKAS